MAVREGGNPATSGQGGQYGDGGGGAGTVSAGGSGGDYPANYAAMREYWVVAVLATIILAAGVAAVAVAAITAAVEEMQANHVTAEVEVAGSVILPELRLLIRLLQAIPEMV